MHKSKEREEVNRKKGATAATERILERREKQCQSVMFRILLQVTTAPL